jgi:hypothetical protein
MKGADRWISPRTRGLTVAQPWPRSGRPSLPPSLPPPATKEEEEEQHHHQHQH